MGEEQQAGMETTPPHLVRNKVVVRNRLPQTIMVSFLDDNRELYPVRLPPWGESDPVYEDQLTEQVRCLVQAGHCLIQRL